MSQKFNHKLNDKLKILWYSVTIETKNNYFTERICIMKTMTNAFFYMSECQAIFQYEEYSFCEARSYQDKRMHGSD